MKLYETEAKLRARVAEIKDPKEVKEFLEHVGSRCLLCVFRVLH